MLLDSIFHQYDIRGIYPSQLNEDTYYVLGRAFAVYLSKDKIAVGYDMRLSSPSLFDAFTRGIMDQGTDVVNLGLISTEINYFASGKFGFPANAIVSASHNPAEYNGLKIVTRGAVPLNGEYGLPQIKKLAMENKFTKAAESGRMEQQNVLDAWIAHTLTFIDAKKLKPLKVVVDAGNGTGGISWEKLAPKLPLSVIPMYFEPDGHFPHHLPDPLKSENIKDLQAEIKKQKADAGFSIDGDADRFFALDELGRRISGTVTTAALAAYFLKKYGPATILYNAVCGKIVPETIKKYGGKPLRVRVGHSFIKEYMKREDALFAGEHSGHFYFRDNFFADSSTIAGLIFLEYLSGQNKPLSEAVAEFDKYKSSGEINFKTADAPGLVKEIQAKFKDATETDLVDGLSVWYPDWWFNLRASNTEPVVRLNLEADNETVLENKLAQVESEIKKLGGSRK